jgi:hypothetical protein
MGETETQLVSPVAWRSVQSFGRYSSDFYETQKILSVKMVLAKTFKPQCPISNDPRRKLVFTNPKKIRKIPIKGSKSLPIPVSHPVK